MVSGAGLPFRPPYNLRPWQRFQPPDITTCMCLGKSNGCCLPAHQVTPAFCRAWFPLSLIPRLEGHSLDVEFDRSGPLYTYIFETTEPPTLPC